VTTKQLEFSTLLPTTARGAYDWHTRPGAIDRMMPPWQQVKITSPRTELADGSIVRFELGRSPLALKWEARHENVEQGRGFADRQLSGPFRSWLHSRTFADTQDGTSRLEELIDYELPMAPISSLIAGKTIRKELERVFSYRHRTLKSDLAVQARYSSAAPLRIAISGATGLLGTALAAFLSTAGHEVLRLVRSTPTGPDEVLWDTEKGVLEPQKIEGIDAVVHLAGANIAGGRWSTARKAEIRRSRKEGTARLIESLTGLESPPKHFLCASAIGYYGETGTQQVDETDGPGEGFLTEVCEEWEAAADQAITFADRVLKLRFGVILSPSGGALAKMLPPFRFGAGGVIGSGKQFMSWISLDDAVAAVLHCLATPSLEGAVDIVSPNACTNRDFTKILGRVLRRPTIAPLPSPAVKLLFGEMGEAMLLGSTRVAPTRLLETGFRFSYGALEQTLRHILGRSPENIDLSTAALLAGKAA
jgi:uncharacterized protein (TIGR01777 family)